MRGRRWAAGVVALPLALGLAGCGGSSSGHAAGSASGGRPLHLYRATMTGRAERHGAPHGVGIGLVSIHSASVVCWRFAHLHGFVHATVAHIHIGGRGKSGAIVVRLSTGSRLHHQGCTRAPASAVTAIERNPAGYYVNVHSAAYPAGAVRGQL